MNKLCPSVSIYIVYILVYILAAFHIGSSLSVGDSCVLTLLGRGMWATRRVFALIQDGGLRSYEDFWVHFATCDYSRLQRQVSTDICQIRFNFIQTSQVLKFPKAEITLEITRKAQVSCVSCAGRAKKF